MQIKYAELPTFKEVLAAGTAAALVPIRSINDPYPRRRRSLARHPSARSSPVWRLEEPARRR